MPGMQSFVKGKSNGRSGSPHNVPQPVNPQRQAQAANLKVALRAGGARPSTAQAASARGESIAQPGLVISQQHLQRRLLGEAPKGDPYDTDAESSLNTTTDRSVIQVEDVQRIDRQQLQPDHVQAEDEDEDEDEEEDEEEDDDDDHDDEDNDDDEGYAFTDDQIRYLEEHNMLDASNEDQVRFLRQGPQYLFPIIDGDSYPSTTDGVPTHIDEQEEASAGDQHMQSPSPQRSHRQGQNAVSFDRHFMQPMSTLNTLQSKPAMPQSSKIFSQSAQIRSQQRNDVTAYTRGQSSQQHITAHLPSSQPPSYSQAAQEQSVIAPLSPQRRPEASTQTACGLPQRSPRPPAGGDPSQGFFPSTIEPAARENHISIARQRVAAPVQPCTEHVPVDESSINNLPATPDGDYDTNILFEMKYDQLRSESFDRNPRGYESVLPEEMHDKPLEDRLQFARDQLEPAAQNQFFSALPTNEWEDAGDWFLDQFSLIIKRTKEARQKKRKEAEKLENEIETRHKHVAKKQRLVESAMAKMQTQGERLMPKSPRATKSSGLRGA